VGVVVTSSQLSGWDHQIAASGPPACCVWHWDHHSRLVFDHGPHRWTYTQLGGNLRLVRYTRFVTGNGAVAVTLRYSDG
jgi:hypothetical protein